MTNQERKNKAREILEKLMNADTNKANMKAEFVGIEFNEKGNFYSAIISVELEMKHYKNTLSVSKDIKIPLNLLGDVDIHEKEVDKTELKPDVEDEVISE